MGIFKNWHSEKSAAPIAVYRICFGLLMLFSTLRFIAKGWVESLYIKPSFHFSYQGFDWLPLPSGNVIWIIFTLLILTSVLITLGLFYRAATIIFFLSFSYVELLDKTNYLNHYYFVTLVAFLLIFISANRTFSLDRYFQLTKSSLTAKLWEIRILQFQIAVVYLFAGLAKIESDWLIDAQPLKYWLHTSNHLWLIGDLLKADWVAYLFSWFGCLYDLTIVVFLIIPKTRKIAFFVVILFHLTTWLLFPIGIFPWVMIAATTIFFSAEFHEKIIIGLSRCLPKNPPINSLFKKTNNKVINMLLGAYICAQILIPLRFLMYKGDLFWTENGYRFSWRVMLMEKTAHATFYIIDQSQDSEIEINNAAFLTKNQEKMMATQPDMILQYSNYLAEIYNDTIVTRYGHDMKFYKPEVHAEIYVTLNGRPHQEYVSKETNLILIDKNENPVNWLVAFNE